MSWPLVELGSIAEKIDYGLTASANFEIDEPKFLRITDLQNDSVDWSTVPSCECTKKEIEQYRLASGDIVFARTGATTGKSYLLKNCDDSIVFASYLIRLRPSKDVDPLYLSYFFKSPQYWQQISVMANGAAQPGVNASKLKELIVPLPPLAEQKRIAAILDKADAIRRKRQQAIKLADEFLRSVFLDMFGDPVTNPKGWERCDFEYLTDMVTYGLTVRPEYHEEGIPLISAKEIRSGEIDFGICQRIAEHDFNSLSSKARPQIGDILFSKTGSIGHCAMVEENITFAITQNAARIVPNRSRCIPEFLIALLRTKYFYNLANKEAKGNAVKDLQLGVMKGFLVYLPPIELQQEYVKLADKSKQMIKKIEASSEVVMLSFSALSQKAFSGSL